MEVKQILKDLIIKFGNYYEEEKQNICERLEEMNEFELLSSVENMINYYIKKHN